MMNAYSHPTFMALPEVMRYLHGNFKNGRRKMFYYLEFYIRNVSTFTLFEIVSISYNKIYYSIVLNVILHLFNLQSLRVEYQIQQNC